MDQQVHARRIDKKYLYRLYSPTRRAYLTPALSIEDFKKVLIITWAMSSLAGLWEKVERDIDLAEWGGTSCLRENAVAVDSPWAEEDDQHISKIDITPESQVAHIAKKQEENILKVLQVLIDSGILEGEKK